jgi:transglutaminase-like putative cysteine protease
VKRFAAALAVFVAAPLLAAPDWVTAAARTPTPAYAADARAVILHDSTEMSFDGVTMVTHRRRVARILTAAGRDLAQLDLFLDGNSTLTTLRAWSITNGVEKSVGERDAVESAAFGDVFDDLRAKMLRIPGAQPGSIVAYEYEERTERADTREATWHFQGDVPVVETTFALALQQGWAREAHWIHFEPPPHAADGSAWTLHDVPAIGDERRRPDLTALAGRLSINFGIRKSWSDIARWYTQLAEWRCKPSPQITEKVHSLVAGSAPALDRIRTLGAFVQRQVRYVAVEIGIGGYQPHPAADVFANRYGDCKDKVTLLRSMLREAGIESYYVLVNATPGVVDAEFPSTGMFNHAIIAVRLPPGAATSSVYSSLQHPRLGTLLFFDPTSSVAPVGYLPLYLQHGRGLLVTGDTGELIELPAAPPAANQLRRRGTLRLDANGTLSGEVEEVRTGELAADLRLSLRPLKVSDRLGAIESAVGTHLADFSTTDVKIENLDEPSADLVIRYKVVVPGYAKRTAGLVLVRPRVLGQKEESIVDATHRTYAYVTDGPSLQTDDFEIALPDSLHLDELPPPMTLSNDFLSYTSSSKAADGKLTFHRQYEMRAFSAEPSKLPELNRAFSKIAADERGSAVFKP